MADRPDSLWPQRAVRTLRHSLRWRLVLVFLLLAVAMTGTFLLGMQKAFSVGWREAARPLVSNYVQRLGADLGTPPSIERAQILVQKLPLSVRIEGPVINWNSHPGKQRPGDWERLHGHTGPHWLEYVTADGHRVQFGLGEMSWEHEPGQIGWITLAVMLGLTAIAYGYVRRLLRPLDDIRAGAQRFGAGDFSQGIPQRRADELGELAAQINNMAHDISRMLDAKRGLLLAISHELRSPLTRARLNAELLADNSPAAADAPTHEALLRDLGQMRDLITDLLESERLSSPHVALHLEPTVLADLVSEVLTTLPGTDRIEVLPLPAMLPIPLDRSRMRLLLRNLLSNALRHGGPTPERVQVGIARDGPRWVLSVRDFGPGVDPLFLPYLTEPFFRPDAARRRSTGGVGLGLYLCRLVAQAHGGDLQLSNAQLGLRVEVSLPT